MPLLIRPERPNDFYSTEYMIQKAFWNLHNPGCSEHLLVHMLRSDPAYLPELSRVAELDGHIVGAYLVNKLFAGHGFKIWAIEIGKTTCSISCYSVHYWEPGAKTRIF